MADSMRNAKLPLALCEAAEQRFGARFGSLDNFLTYLLEQVVRNDAAPMDQEEQRIIEDRLRDLGYV